MVMESLTTLLLQWMSVADDQVAINYLLLLLHIVVPPLHWPLLFSAGWLQQAIASCLVIFGLYLQPTDLHDCIPGLWGAARRGHYCHACWCSSNTISQLIPLL